MACWAAATRSGFCTCGTSGSDSRNSRASSFGPSAVGPVTAADQRDANALPAEPAGEPLDQRRLARAAQREIAYAHHRHVNAKDFRLAAIEAAIPPTHGGRIEALRNS